MEADENQGRGQVRRRLGWGGLGGQWTQEAGAETEAMAAAPDRRKQLQRPDPHPAPTQPPLNTPFAFRPRGGQACRNRWDTRSNPWLSAMSPKEAFGDAVWVAKNVKRIWEGEGRDKGALF